GGVTLEALERVVGEIVGPVVMGDAAAEPEQPRSPGMLLRHYAPAVPVRLDARTVVPGEALLAFGSAVPTGAAKTLNLSPSGDLREAAANLFRFMRALDRAEHKSIAVMPIPEEG